jgi:hypothetical protein
MMILLQRMQLLALGIVAASSRGLNRDVHLGQNRSGKMTAVAVVLVVVVAVVGRHHEIAHVQENCMDMMHGRGGYPHVVVVVVDNDDEKDSTEGHLARRILDGHSDKDDDDSVVRMVGTYEDDEHEGGGTKKMMKLL